MWSACTEPPLVICVDEKSQCQPLERTQPMLPTGVGYVEERHPRSEGSPDAGGSYGSSPRKPSRIHFIETGLDPKFRYPQQPFDTPPDTPNMCRMEAYFPGPYRLKNDRLQRRK